MADLQTAVTDLQLVTAVLAVEVPRLVQVIDDLRALGTGATQAAADAIEASVESIRASTDTLATELPAEAPAEAPPA